MRSWLLTIVLLAFLTTVAQAELPKSLEQFQQQITTQAKDPKGAVRLWFDAVYVFLTVDKELGQKLILEMDRYKEWDSRSFRTFRQQIAEKPYIMFSYAKAATPENKYEFDPKAYELTFGDNINTKPFADKEEGEYVKLFIKSNGADLPRPITLMRNKRGEYKFYEFSSLYVGVRPPKMPVIFGASIPESKDPKWVARQWLQGILLYLAGEKETGLKQMNALMVDPTDEKFDAFHGAMAPNKSYIWRSYVKGTSPDTQYVVADPYTIEIESHFQPGEDPKEDSRLIRMFIHSSGADTDRPLKLSRDDKGEWRVSEFSSFCVGVRAPKQPKIFGESVPESTDPVWVVHEWLHGILLYLAGEKEKGLKLMNSLMKEPTDEKFFDFHGALSAEKAHIWRSYAKGTTPANQYKIADVNNFEIETYYQPGEEPTAESVKIRMFVRSTGADTARPIKLEIDDRGQWRVEEFSSLCVDCRPPVDPNAGDF